MEPVKEILSFTVVPENTNDLRFINPLVIRIISSLFVDLKKKLKPIKKLQSDKLKISSFSSV